MNLCLQWATAAVAALAIGLHPPPTDCLGEGEIALTVGGVHGVSRVSAKAEAGLNSAERRKDLAPMANHLAGVWSLTVGDPSSAALNFRKAISLDPELAIAKVGLIVAERRAGHADGVRQAVKALARAPGELRGPADLQLFTIDEQLAPMLEGLVAKADPPCAACWRYLGDAYAAAALRRSQHLSGPWWDRTAAALRAVLSITPGDREARESLGRALASQGRPAAALVVYREGLERDPSWAKGRLLAGAALLDRYRAGEAIPYLEAAAEAGLGRQAWSALGAAYRSVGRSGEAAKAYSEALKLNAPRASDLLGVHHASLQDGSGGRVDLVEQATQVAPKLPDAWFALAQARQAAGDSAGGARALERYRTHYKALQDRLVAAEVAGLATMSAAEALKALSKGRRASAPTADSGLAPLARAAIGPATAADLEAISSLCADLNR